MISLFGTGIRGRSSPAAVRLRAGDDLEVLYAGPLPEYAGLDQVNFRIPPGLPDESELALTVDGCEADRVILSFTTLR